MKKTVLYTITGMISPVLMLVLLPIYLKYLTQTEYIILALTNSFLAVFSIFFNLKTDQAYRTIYFYYLENKEKQTDLFRTVFSFTLLSSLLWLLLFYFIGNTVFGLIFKNDISFFPFSFIILSSFLIGNLCTLYFIYLQNNSKATEYSLLAIGSILGLHALQLTCVYVFKTSFFWFLCSGLLMNLLLIIFIYFRKPSLFKFSISKKLLVESLRFSLPFLPFLILYNLENQLDRFFIERYLLLQELAKYVVLISIISAVVTFFNSIDNAIRPELYHLLGKKEAGFESKIEEQFDFYLFVGLVAMSFLIAFGTNIEWFLENEKYAGISSYFIPMVIAFLPLIGIRFLALQLVFEKRMSKINWFTALKLVIMTGLFYILIPVFGIAGAMISIGISNAINLLLFYYLTEIKIIPSAKILTYTIAFILINSTLLFFTEIKSLSLMTIMNCGVFGVLFLIAYWKKLKTILK